MVAFLDSPLTVAADGSGHYTTIQAAIDAIVNSHTIYVKNGTYNEHLNLNKAITLENYAGHTPVIDGSDSLTPTINVTAAATLRGFTINGAHALGAGIHYHEANVLASAALTVEDCTITNFAHCGIKTNKALMVRNTTIHTGGDNHLDHCIYIAAGDVGGHTIENCEFYGATGWGVHLYSYEYNATITGNNIHNNRGGILVTGEGHTITNNTITNNAGGNGVDFFHYGLTNLTVTGNTLSGNSAYDLFLDGTFGAGNTISGNTGTKNF